MSVDDTPRLVSVDDTGLFACVIDLYGWCLEPQPIGSLPFGSRFSTMGGENINSGTSKHTSTLTTLDAAMKGEASGSQRAIPGAMAVLRDSIILSNIHTAWTRPIVTAVQAPAIAKGTEYAGSMSAGANVTEYDDSRPRIVQLRVKSRNHILRRSTHTVGFLGWFPA